MVEQVILHDEHYFAWIRDQNGLSHDVGLASTQNTLMYMEGLIPLPPVWRPEGQDQSHFTEIKQQPNITPYAEPEYNNPHMVTASQIGVYTDLELKEYVDPDVIDVDAREVQEPKQLPPPKES